MEQKASDILKEKAEWFRTAPEDPHNINTAVYVALLSVAEALEKVNL